MLYDYSVLDSLNYTCECNDPCIERKFSTDVSYSSLSTGSMIDLLVKNFSTVDINFGNAIQIKYRTTDTFIVALENLKRSIDSHKIAMDFIDSKILDMESSIPNKIETVISEMLKDTRSIKATLFSDHSKYLEEYKSKRLRSHIAFLNSLDRTANYLNDYSAVLEAVAGEDLNISSSWAKQVEQEAALVLPYSKWALDVFMSIRAPNSSYLPIFSNKNEETRRDCTKELENIKSSIADLEKSWGNASYLSFDISSYPFVDDFFSATNSSELETVKIIDKFIENFQQQTLTIKGCTDEYYTFLQEIDIWLDELDKDFPEIANSLVQEEELPLLKNDQSLLVELYDDQVFNRKTLFDLSEEAKSDKISNINDNLKEVEIKIRNSILTPLYTKIRSSETWMLETYLSALRKATDFGKYFDEHKPDKASEHEVSARDLNLWKKPLPNIYSEKASIVIYMY